MSGRGGGRGGRGGGERKLTYREKAGIAFVQNEEPAFIQKMKEAAGYKAPAKIEDKFANEEADDDVPETTEGELLHTKEEERPQVVVLNPETDLTSDDLKKALETQKKLEDEKKIAEGKITFKKPQKRVAADGKEETKEESVDEKRRRAYEPEKKVESRLLSFGEDEDE